MWRRGRFWAALFALCLLATCPRAWRDFQRHQRAHEAPDVLRYLRDLVREQYTARNGRLPQQSAGPTPPIGRCCEQGGQCNVDNDLWTDPAWRELRFSLDEPFRYSYQYEVVDGGRSVVLRAIGDLDCDGIPSTYELRLDPDGDGNLVEKLTSDKPEE
jgi:hypothetical protein